MSDEINRTMELQKPIPPALAEAVRRLVEAYQPEEIWLFGSHARGDAGPDSDYDLMIIVPDDADSDRRRSSMAYRSLKGIGFPKDVVVSTHTYFHARLHRKATLPAIVQSEGKLLYAA